MIFPGNPIFCYQRIIHLIMDRISELPEVVVQQILSFLPTKQVVQSTLLSTTWKHVWSTFPILRFDDTYLKLWSSESNKKRKHDFVENTLRSHRRKRLRINSFTLNVPCWVEDKSMSCVDSWIGFVVECDVQELILEFRWSYYKNDYHRFRLPHTLLVAKSLTVLTLCRCNLEATCGYGDTNLPSLKKLSLTMVYANDQIIQNLVDGCPLIEYMRFSCCPGITTIKLSAGVSKLMAIEVACFDDLQRLNFEASNLHSLSISRKSELELILCKNLKQLMLFYVSITDKWLNDYLSRLQHLENLQIAYCSMLVRIKIRGHHLKSLQLRGNSTVEVKIDAPKLSKFSYYGDCATSLSLNPLALSEAIYDLTNNLNSSTYNPNSDVEKIEFLSKLSNSKLLILKINSAKVFLKLFISFDHLLIHFFHSIFFLVFVIIVYQF